MVTKKLLNWMIILTIIAIIISSYLLYIHYTQDYSVCTLDESFDCGTVDESKFSEFPPGSGIPVSLIGILVFIVTLIALGITKHKKTKRKTRKILSKFIFYLFVLGLLFALYLLYTEIFIIHSICIMCLSLDIIIIIMLILSYKLKKHL